MNVCIEKGPNLVELIPSILNRFRVGKITDSRKVVEDIRKAFLQIFLNEKDKDYTVDSQFNNLHGTSPNRMLN